MTLHVPKLMMFLGLLSELKCEMNYKETVDKNTLSHPLTHYHPKNIADYINRPLELFFTFLILIVTRVFKKRK